MGINRTLDPWKLFQDWAQAVEKRTNGRVQFELTSLPELGLGGAETLRVIKTGVVDVAEIYGGYVAGELPMVEILELPGIFPDRATAKKAILAWKAHETKILDQKANAVLLAMAVYPDQAFFSKKAVRKPADFKGLKTRVHSVALASLVAGLGGEPLTVAFAETYTALERGTLDAAISGTKPGFGLRWYEVSKYLVGPISMRPHVSLAVNKTTWKRLPPDIQKIMKDEAETLVEGQVVRADRGLEQGRDRQERREGHGAHPVLAGDPGRDQGRPAQQGGARLGEAGRRRRGRAAVQRDHRARWSASKSARSPADERRAAVGSMPALARVVDCVFIWPGYLAGALYFVLAFFVTYDVLARKWGAAVGLPDHPGHRRDQRLHAGPGGHLGLRLRAAHRRRTCAST